MKAASTTERKILLWAMLISSLTGLSIIYIPRLFGAPLSDWFGATMTTFSFFTNLTNAIIITMAAALLYSRGRLYDFFKSPSVQAACCLYIAFVGIAFWLLLGGPGQLETLVEWLPEITLHALSPILGFVYWFRVVPTAQLSWRNPLIWVAYPAGYLVYWLFRGPLVGYYPYFFIDVNSQGFGGVAIWSGALILIVFVLGSLMLFVDRQRST